MQYVIGMCLHQQLIQQTFLEKLIFLLKMSASCIKFLFCHMTDCCTLNEVIYTLYLQLDLADGSSIHCMLSCLYEVTMFCNVIYYIQWDGKDSLLPLQSR